HIAGLKVAGGHPSTLPFTDVVMTTTHKTLRGPRGAIILCKEKYAKQIDKSVFPGMQGGPHENVIAAKAIAFKEATTSAFRDYAHQTIKNAQALANALIAEGVSLITGGTDNHLILIDARPLGIGRGKELAIALESAGICVNANSVPYDPSPPMKPSGIRIGTPILTTRDMREPEMQQVGRWIAQVLKNPTNSELHLSIKSEVRALCERFPLP
ncbi:MAG: serine hydroxymethyltransferase, partial [Nanoarchaeota archaeon]